MEAELLRHLQPVHERLLFKPFDRTLEITEDLVSYGGKKAAANTNQARDHIKLRPDSLELMLIAVGHERGHGLWPFYRATSVEETKAYLFQFRWTKELLRTAPEELQEGLARLEHQFLRDPDYQPDSPVHQAGLKRARNYWNRNDGDWRRAHEELYATFARNDPICQLQGRLL